MRNTNSPSAMEKETSLSARSPLGYRFVTPCNRIIDGRSDERCDVWPDYVFPLFGGLRPVSCRGYGPSPAGATARARVSGRTRAWLEAHVVEEAAEGLQDALCRHVHLDGRDGDHPLLHRQGVGPLHVRRRLALPAQPVVGSAPRIAPFVQPVDVALQPLPRGGDPPPLGARPVGGVHCR